MKFVTESSSTATVQNHLAPIKLMTNLGWIVLIAKRLA